MAAARAELEPEEQVGLVAAQAARVASAVRVIAGWSALQLVCTGWLSWQTAELARARKMLAKGGDMRHMMAELFGKSTGFNGGKGGSMHIADFKIGMLGAGLMGAGVAMVTAQAGIEVVLSRERPVEELRDTLASNLEELQRVAGIVQDMLFLSQADRGSSARRVDTASLAGVARQVADYHDAALDDAGVRVEVIGDTEIFAREAKAAGAERARVSATVPNPTTKLVPR